MSRDVRHKHRVEKAVDWLLELSVLVTVLPVVEQLVVHEGLRLFPTLWTLAAGGTALIVGLYFAGRS